MIVSIRFNYGCIFFVRLSVGIVIFLIFEYFVWSEKLINVSRIVYSILLNIVFVFEIFCLDVLLLIVIIVLNFIVKVNLLYINF